MQPDPPLPLTALFRDHDLAVVLSGGAALGAYHMGACEELLARGRTPHWMVGASIGAVTAAILLGNPPETRHHRLKAFWTALAQPAAGGARTLPGVRAARLGNAFGLWALLTGRPGALQPRFPGLFSLMPFMPPDPALHDHRPMAGLLHRLIDFDRLNSGEARLSVVALDLATREEVWFDTRDTRIEADHLLAATALVPLIAPVEVARRSLCDAGLANNLPVDRVLGAELARPVLCIAADLFTRTPIVPRTLDEAVIRIQDLAFAIQADRTLDAAVRQRDLRGQLAGSLPRVLVGQITYDAPDAERSLKALDFSATALRDRAACGRRDMLALLQLLADAPAEEGATRVIRLDEARPAPPGHSRAAGQPVETLA